MKSRYNRLGRKKPRKSKQKGVVFPYNFEMTDEQLDKWWESVRNLQIDYYKGVLK